MNSSSSLLNDYESKLSNLLNNFDDGNDEDTPNNNQNDKDRKFTLCLEKNNDNVLINLTNDECYLVELNKKSLDLSLGDKIVSSIFEELRTRQKEEFNMQNNQKQLEKAMLNKKRQSSNPVNTLISKNENELQFLITNDKKICLNNKLSYKDYFNMPKCDLCDLTGVTNEELKKISNKLVLIDSLVMDYILYQCSICKVYSHKNCAYEVTTFPVVNFKDNYSLNLTWVCDMCKKNALSDKKLDSCQICNKKDFQLKKPHLKKQIENDLWMHNWCLLWFSINGSSSEESSSIQRRLKEFNLSQVVNSPCYKCQDSNTKLFTMKCSFNACQKSFHPICIRETLAYFNITYLNEEVLATCYCEDHSSKFLIKNLNSLS